MNAVFVLAFFIVTFALVTLGVAWLAGRGGSSTKSWFLIANRKIGLTAATFTIAASWVWAPALFVSAQKAYEQGIIGLFWFTVPNVLALMLFSWFAVRMREAMPEGYTCSDYMRLLYSKRVQRLYWFTLSTLTVCAFAVQLLAGGSVLSSVTGIPYFWTTVIVSSIPLAYTMFFGFKSSVLTDFSKLLWVLGIGLLLIPAVIWMAGGLSVVTAGLGGKSGTYYSLFNAQGRTVFWTFGLSTCVGLLSGPFGDQAFWQRGFAIMSPKLIRRAFIQGALLFAVVPLAMSLLGFVAAGSHLTTTNPQLINLQTVRHFLPLALIPFLFVVLASLTSILDSKLSAISSIAGHDMAGADASNQKSMIWARVSMVLLVLGALAIANIPGLKIVHLFLFYGTVRAAGAMPTAMSLWRGRAFSEQGVYYGVWASVLIGLPIFAYGNFIATGPHQPLWLVSGSLLTVLLSGLITYIVTRIKGL